MLLGLLQEHQPAWVTVVGLMLQQLLQLRRLPVPVLLLLLCPALHCPALWLAERAV